MWGAFLRAAIYAPIAALLSAILTFILARFLPLMGPKDELLYRSFASVSEHSLAVMLLSILLGIVAAAVVERRPV